MTGRLLAIGLAFIVVLGAAYAAWTLRNDRAVHDSKDAALRTHLAQMRSAIAKFEQDHGRHPYSLDELVPAYLRRIPADPMTGAADWQVDTEEVVEPARDFADAPATPARSHVIDVHSAAGKPYSDY